MITQASCKFTSSLLAYFEKTGAAAQPLFDVFDLPEEFLKDSHGWIQMVEAEKLFQISARLVNDFQVGRTVGLLIPELQSWGALDNVFKIMSEDPKNFYSRLDRFFSYFLTPIEKFKEIERTDSFVRFEFPFERATFPHLFDFLMAVLEVLPRYAGGEPVLVDKSNYDSTVMISWDTAQPSLFSSLDSGRVVSPRLISQMSKMLEVSQRKIEVLKLENQKLQSRIREQVHEQVYAEKMRGLAILAAGVAHEINNPLSFITSNLHRLREYFISVREYLDQSENLDPVVRQAFKERLDLPFILSEIPTMMSESMDGLGRVKEIVKDLSSLAHPEQERQESKMETNLNLLLESSIKVFSDKFKDRIEVRKQLQLDEEVEIYPVRMSQVLINLINNAIQAIPQSGFIEIKTWKDETHAILEIKDSGEGMDEGTLSKIFTPFFTTKPAGRGTGLGLCIAQSIVEMHQGQIDVKSERGQGSSFIVKLPRSVHVHANN